MPDHATAAHWPGRRELQLDGARRSRIRSIAGGVAMTTVEGVAGDRIEVDAARGQHHDDPSLYSFFDFAIASMR